MKANGRSKEAPVFTVVEHPTAGNTGSRRRWVLLNSDGAQMATVYHSLEPALRSAALQTRAWQLWLDQRNTFCR